MTKRINESQIVKILDEAKSGERSIDDLCRQYGISRSTYYSWRDKYAGMTVSDIKKLKQLEEENRKLKQMYADLSLEITVLKDIIEKKL
jgi:putative transposase